MSHRISRRDRLRFGASEVKKTLRVRILRFEFVSEHERECGLANAAESVETEDGHACVTTSQEIFELFLAAREIARWWAEMVKCGDGDGFNLINRDLVSQDDVALLGDYVLIAGDDRAPLRIAPNGDIPLIESLILFRRPTKATLYAAVN